MGSSAIFFPCIQHLKVPDFQSFMYLLQAFLSCSSSIQFSTHLSSCLYQLQGQNSASIAERNRLDYCSHSSGLTRSARATEEVPPSQHVCAHKWLPTAVSHSPQAVQKDLQASCHQSQQLLREGQAGRREATWVVPAKPQGMARCCLESELMLYKY